MSENRTDDDKQGLDRWWIASGVIVALCLLLLVYVVAPWGKDHNTSGGSPQGTSAPSVGASPSSTGATTGCPTPAVSDTVPTGPVTAEWNLVDRVALPSSKAGPHITTGLRRCYDHSPQGALLAAANISYGLTGSSYKDVYSHQVMSGPNASSAEQDQDSAAKEAPTSQIAQIRGYRFMNYSPERAQIQLLTGTDDTSTQQYTLLVQWSGDDWKINADAPGGYISPQPASMADGFTQWSGV